MKNKGARLKQFQNTVLNHYRLRGRSFPWRETVDPYHILVSEIMLQQTQTDRVVDKYLLFLKAFKTPHQLAEAPLQKVLSLWQGLGYNRRALLLKRAASIIFKEYAGVIPQSYETLLSLPGVGPYTAGAVMVFAFNKPYPLIETNIRSAFIHHFFPRSKKVSDIKLLPLIKATIPLRNSRQWYQALMDYGSFLKRNGTNPSRRSLHYSKQKPFKGSRRQLRGALLKHLLLNARTPSALVVLTKRKKEDVLGALTELTKEGFVFLKGKEYSLS